MGTTSVFLMKIAPDKGLFLKRKIKIFFLFLLRNMGTH